MCILLSCPTFHRIMYRLFYQRWLVMMFFFFSVCCTCVLYWYQCDFTKREVWIGNDVRLFGRVFLFCVCHAGWWFLTFPHLKRQKDVCLRHMVTAWATKLTFILVKLTLISCVALLTYSSQFNYVCIHMLKWASSTTGLNACERFWLCLYVSGGSACHWAVIDCITGFALTLSCVCA